MVAIGAIGWQLWEMPPTRCLLPIQVPGATYQVCHLPDATWLQERNSATFLL